MRRLLIAAGLDSERVPPLVEHPRLAGARIGHRLNGAEATDYAASGLAYGPRKGPFEWCWSCGSSWE